MAETFVTLTFLSAIFMTLSIFTSYGKWVPSFTALFSILSFLQLPEDSIQQSGGGILVTTFVMSLIFQFNIYRGAEVKVVNSLGGIVVCIIMLNGYPKDGITETIFEYTMTENILQFVYASILGFVIGQMYVNIVKFDRNLTVVAILFYFLFLIIGEIETESSFFVIITSSMIFGILPYFETMTSQKIGTGDGRTLALGLSTLIGIVIIFILTFVSVSTENRIGDGSGAFAVAMWLTLGVSTIGLGGMLLPIAGFDQHPRPEGWGLRISLSLSPMLLSFQTDLVNHILLGVIFAILISISAPLVIEKKSSKPSQ